MTKEEKVKQTSLPFMQTFLAKGFLFIGLLLAYVTFFVIVVLQERDAPIKHMREYEQIQFAENALIQADLAAYRVVTSLFSGVKNNDMLSIVKYFGELRESHETLARVYPEKAEAFRNLVNMLSGIIANPTSENFQRLHMQLLQNKSSIDALLADNRQKREKLLTEYSRHSDDVLTTTLTLSVTGLVLLGGLTSLFFWQLGRDINNLRLRVRDIVKGFRGAELPVSRTDELGQLIHGINRMANELKAREKDLEMERIRSSYHEKMIAIESLAGGIAHEIGNPITCISGLAHELENAIASEDPIVQEHVASIVRYSDALAEITRELSILTTPNKDLQQLLDFNQLVMQTCGLLQFDSRWANVKLNYDFDYALPAFKGYQDQLALALDHILENALHALNDAEVQDPHIDVKTTYESATGIMRCTITDNGAGMDEFTVKRVFEPFFSTKPVGSGTGLGLSLCWSIISTHDGEIKIDSKQNQGTTVTITIPSKVTENEKPGVSYG